MLPVIDCSATPGKSHHSLSPAPYTWTDVSDTSDLVWLHFLPFFIHKVKSKILFSAKVHDKVILGDVFQLSLFFLKKNKALLYLSCQRQNKVMDIIRQKDGGVGAEIKLVVAEEGPGEGEWEMNNCLTGGMKKAQAEAAPSRVAESVA